MSLPSPPLKPRDNQTSSWLYVLLPLLSSVSMAAYMISAGRTWLMVLGILFVFLSVGVTVYVRTQMRRQNGRNMRRQRDRYLEYLGELRKQARESAATQREVSAFLYPSPRRLWALVIGRRRIWERRPSDPDFLRVRLGLGRGEPALRLDLARRSDPMSEYEAESEWAAEDLMKDCSTVSLQPAWVDLANVGVLSLLGPPDRGGNLLGLLLMQVAVLHAPDDVRLVVLLSDPESMLSWAKWLPHCRLPEVAGNTPTASATLDGIADLLEARLDRVRKERVERTKVLPGARREAALSGRLVVVLDGYRPDAPWAKAEVIEELLAEAGPASGIHVVCVATKEREEPGRVDARARVEADGRLVLESRNPSLVSDVSLVVADSHLPRLSELAARVLSPLRLSGERDQVLSRTIALPEMFGIADLGDFDPTAFWREPDDETLLRLPIGLNGDGEPLVLDLKESAMGGIGPHGLVVGATGSGKSELLRTLVTGLTMTHAPEQLSFVLVDFKGGATFAGVTELPHVAGLITNLADDLALVDRMRAALQGEQQRRQRMLRDAGDVDSVQEYQVRCAQGVPDSKGRPLEPMPYLMIIVDEFGELLSQRSDFIDLFVQIGRVGRSLGMHLLLATQRLEEGRLRGLDSHLSYRICLRTFSPGESRTVIGTADAYRLPPIPGSAYLKVDESVYERFRVAHISGVYSGPWDETNVPAGPAPEPLPFGLRTLEDTQVDGAEDVLSSVTLLRPKPGQRTEMQVAVEQVKAHGRAVHQVWLPQLPRIIELDSLIAPTSSTTERGFASELWPSGARLSFPIGVVDLPTQQEQRALLLDLSGKHGHLLVVGAPQSGKSTLLRTALLGAMLTHTPDELQFLCVDFGGGTLAGLEGAPHVSGVATRHDEARTRRALAVVSQMVEQRERLFRKLRIDTADEFRRMRDARELAGGVNAADVVLVIDNWAALRGAVEQADEIVQDVAARGLGVAVHLLLTTNRWGEVRPNLRDKITGRLELRLNEPSESEISRPAAKQLRTAVAGRGIVAPGHVFHTALPRIDGVASTDNLVKAQDAVVSELAASWLGEPAPELRVLSELITLPELEKACADQVEAGADTAPASAVPIGIRELDLQPASLDLSAESPHFLVLGDSGSGKSAFLRSWMRGLARRTSPWETRFVVIDYRRGLSDAVPDEYLGAVAGDADTAAAYVTQIVEKLKERTPPPGITSRELRKRDWWTGPEIYLVIDDYDLARSARLPALNEYLTQAADIGFHVLIAHRISGITRAMTSNSLVGGLRDLRAGGLILSGDRREGVLLADQRAAERPPGRGALVSRRAGHCIVQTIYDDDGLSDGGEIEATA